MFSFEKLLICWIGTGKVPRPKLSKIQRSFLHISVSNTEVCITNKGTKLFRRQGINSLY